MVSYGFQGRSLDLHDVEHQVNDVPVFLAMFY